MTSYRVVDKNGDFVDYVSYESQDRFLRDLMRKNLSESFEVKHEPFKLQKKEDEQWQDVSIKLD